MRGWTRLGRAAAVAAFTLASLPGTPTQAQSAPSTPPSPGRHTLSGHAIPALAHSTPLHPTDPSTQLSLSISLETHNQAQLNALIQQQRDPHSSSFQRYLSPDEYTAQFGPRQPSLDAVTAFLTSQGLHVTGVSPNHLLVNATGSVDTVERAFQVHLEDFAAADGRTVYAPTTEPSVPASLAGIVHGIVGLDNAVKLHPHLRRSTTKAHNGTGPLGSGYAPADLRTAYDMNPLPTGSGQSVALVEFDTYVPADIGVFDAQFGLPSTQIVNRFIDGMSFAQIGDGATEVELDIEVVAGIAPAATQIVYQAPNTGPAELDLYTAIVNDHAARFVSSSWGECEAGRSGAQMDAMDAVLAQGAAEGIAIFSAAGDTGAYDCRGQFGNPRSVDFPGSDPHVVSVGGTALYTNPNMTYQGETVWNEEASGMGAGGGGLSTHFSLPAYETGPGVSNPFSNGMREVPDVSADADPVSGYSMYCTAGDMFTACGGPVYGGWQEIGGTSAATPLWAAMAADINQYLASQGKPAIGDIHTTLWRLFNTPQTLGAYHDITSGNNDYYPATPAYDMASGIGTPDAWNMARDLAGASTGPASGLITTISPVRVADTRGGGGPIQVGQSPCFAIAGFGGVIPADAAAVVLNVTAVGQTTNGWLTVFPSGQPLPATSTLNFGTSEYAMANGAIMKLGAGGQVCVNVGTVGSVPGSTHIILDVTGYLTPAALAQLSMLPLPQRVADTRTVGGPIPTGGSSCFTVAGVPGIPANAAAVVLNVTAVGYGTAGWLTVYPNGQPVPQTSTLNFDTTEYAMANNTIMRVGTNGQVCVNVGTINASPGSSHVVLDVTGYLTSGGLGQLTMLPSPQRLADTRSQGGPVATGSFRCFGLAGAPPNATSVLLNLTAVSYGTLGWLTAYPAGQGVPATSTLNFDTTEYAMANGAVIQLGAGQQICVNVGTINTAPGSSNIVIDVVGYVTP